MRRSIAIVVLLVVVLAAVAVSAKRSKEKSQAQAKPAEMGVPVALAPVALGSMRETVPVTGSLKALNSAEVRPQISARVAEVRVREGDLVTQGQPILLLDRTDTAAQVRQAQAALATAQAAVGTARAQWQAANSRLQVLQQGARPEERSIARNRVTQAEAAFRKADADLARRKKLFAEGAISREDLDAVQTAYDAAQADLDSARNSSQLTEKGARPEELAAARDEAQAARTQMDSAVAGVGQAQAALARARELLSYTVIKSPVSGVVYARTIEPGEVASPGDDPILRIADLNSVYFEAAVPGRLADQVRVGQSVDVSVRGDGTSRMQGTVLRVIPVADPSNRDFQAWISLPKLPSLSRPGNYAEGKIVVERRVGVPVIPKDALVERSGRRVVFVVTGDTAHARPVQIGLTEVTRVQITRGLQPGERVVVEGAQSLNDGTKVSVQKAGGQ